MLQPDTSRYKEMETAWIALADTAHSCKELIHAVLDDRSQWAHSRRHHHAQIDGVKFDLTELQIHLDMLVENVTHLTTRSDERRVHIAFLSGKRVFVEVNDIPILDQRELEEVAPELLDNVREQIEGLHQSLMRIAPSGFSSK